MHWQDRDPSPILQGSPALIRVGRIGEPTLLRVQALPSTQPQWGGVTVTKGCLAPLQGSASMGHAEQGLGPRSGL